MEEWSFRLGLRVDLSRFGVVVQAAQSDGLSFDPFAFDEDGFAAAEVDVGRGEIIEALVVSPMIVMLDEGGDLLFAVAGFCWGTFGTLSRRWQVDPLRSILPCVCG